MSNPAELADYQWLTESEAAEVLGDLADHDEPLHTTSSRLRRSFPTPRVHLLLEQAELRRRARAKFSRADAMFFTRLGLEQATDQWVARHKAQRFVPFAEDELADLCCGIGGDLLALAEFGGIRGVDRDPVACCLAAANGEVVGVKHRPMMLAKVVEDAPLANVAAWHLDPDRRPQGHRTTAIEWSSPNADTIAHLLAAAPHAAIKLAPAAELPETWRSCCELEWISRDRECRQLVAWHGSLAHAPGSRRATVLSTGVSSSECLIGQPDTPVPFAPTIDRFLVEPDPAILAAHLVGELSRQFALAAFSPGIAYLTGSQPVDSPLATCFQLDEVLPLDVRKVGEVLQARRIGRIEIKKRGVEHDPDEIRKRLRLKGANSATLFLTKLNGKHAAILARRTAPGASALALNAQP